MVQSPAPQLGKNILLIAITLLMLMAGVQLADYLSNWELRSNTDAHMDQARWSMSLEEMPACRSAELARPFDTPEKADIGWNCASSIIAYFSAAIQFQEPDIEQLVAGQAWIREFISSQQNKPWVLNQPHRSEDLSRWELKLQEINNQLPNALFEAGLTYLAIYQSSKNHSELEDQTQRAELQLNVIISYLLGSEDSASKDLGFYLLADLNNMYCHPSIAKPYMDDTFPNCLSMADEIWAADRGGNKQVYIWGGVLLLGTVGLTALLIGRRRYAK